MNNRLRNIAAAAAICIGICASAQYNVVLKDNTTYRFETGDITFTGTTEEDGYLLVGDMSFPLSEVKSVNSIDPSPSAPIVLAYHPYYSKKVPRADLVTHICYGFAEVYVKDNVYEKFALQGEESAFKKVVDVKNENPEVKILLSFSHGVTNSDNKQDGGFSCIAASDEFRRQFAKDCLDFCDKWGIDGIDLDWEFPGISWSGAACDLKNDVENYTLLIKQLRETLGTDHLLTFAGYCMDKQRSGSGWKYIDLKAVEPYVDFVNVMCYDFSSAPQYHNAIKSSGSYWDIDRTVKAYKNAGFPMEKVVLGIPFYVRHEFGTGGSTAFSALKTLAKKKGFVVDNWNETAGVPYVTYNDEMWGSYDNERSIAGKGVYAAEKGMIGLFYWCTHEDDTNYTLARATWDAVRNNWE